MEFIRAWLLGIVGAAILAALAEELSPDGSVKRVVRLVGGVLLLLAVAKPVLTLEEGDMSLALAEYHAQAGGYSEALELENRALTKAIIESETAAYIADKANELGADCRVEVICNGDEEGNFYPSQARLVGKWTGEQQEALAEMMERDLAISREKQQFERTAEE